MDIKIAKEKEPELKFKKEAEVSIHEKELISPRKESGPGIRIKSHTDSLGIRNHPETDKEEPGRTADDRRRPAGRASGKAGFTGEKSCEDSTGTLSEKTAHNSVGKTVTGEKSIKNTYPHKAVEVQKNTKKESQFGESGRGMEGIREMAEDQPMNGLAGDSGFSPDVKQVTKKSSYVKNLNYEDYIALGTLTADQVELLQEVMSEEFRSELPSIGTENGVAALALTKVGCQYSQDRRYEEGFYDCSSLVQRCYAEVGITLPGTSSGQGQYIVEHGLEVTEDMLQPGDLIFYSHENNGEFLNISHVAIYVGNGRMVHAANTARGVVNDPFSPSNIGLYGRPGLGQ